MNVFVVLFFLLLLLFAGLDEAIMCARVAMYIFRGYCMHIIPHQVCARVAMHSAFAGKVK